MKTIFGRNCSTFSKLFWILGECGNITAASVELDGSTSELDAIVISTTTDKDDTTTIQILVLWEGKATLHPMTIHDALTKKFQAVQITWLFPRRKWNLTAVLEMIAAPLFYLSHSMATLLTSNAKETRHG
jgi:hypothetical protein